MPIIRFTTDKAELAIIQKIAERASKTAAANGFKYDGIDALMDIDAVHANGCPLKLQELLDADDTNFAHDVFGIRRHLDRRTGKLTACFDPRFSR
jgi:hypothetical protein